MKSLKWETQGSCLHEVLQGPDWIQPISNEPGDTPNPPHASIGKEEGWVSTTAMVKLNKFPCSTYQIIPGLPQAEK